MKQHKWYNEIVAWASGAEIEMRWTNGEIHDKWRDVHNGFNWNSDLAEFRIKPQPKEPKYLYAIQTDPVGAFGGEIRLIPAGQMFSGTLIGKIEVQDD